MKSILNNNNYVNCNQLLKFNKFISNCGSFKFIIQWYYSTFYNEVRLFHVLLSPLRCITMIIIYYVSAKLVSFRSVQYNFVITIICTHHKMHYAFEIYRICYNYYFYRKSLQMSYIRKSSRLFIFTRPNIFVLNPW